jgi:hypothetical protein
MFSLKLVWALLKPAGARATTNIGPNAPPQRPRKG